MKLCSGWVMSAGLVLAATSANAQIVVPDEGARPLYSAVSDVGGPYAAMPPQAPGYYGPRLLPAPEVYTVLRDNGFSPLGAPQQRGLFYTIAVLDRGGGEGRLVIDARDGRIVRYARAIPMPTWRWPTARRKRRRSARSGARHGRRRRCRMSQAARPRCRCRRRCRSAPMSRRRPPKRQTRPPPSLQNLPNRRRNRWRRPNRPPPRHRPRRPP